MATKKNNNTAQTYSWQEQYDNIQEDSIYNAYREQNERELFNSQIQADNARANAQRYLQNTLNAQGYGSQGYGANQQIAVNNSYANAVGNAQSSYLDRAIEIDQNAQAQIESDLADADANLSNLMQSVFTQANQLSDYNEKMQLLVDNGFYNVDANGNYVINQAFANRLDSATQYELANTIDTWKNTSGTIYDRNNFDSNIYVYTKEGKMEQKTIDSDFKDETNTLNAYLSNNSLQNGQLIELRNYWDKSVYLRYYNGQLYTVSRDEFYSQPNNNKLLIHEKQNMQSWNPPKNIENEYLYNVGTVGHM